MASLWLYYGFTMGLPRSQLMKNEVRYFFVFGLYYFKPLIWSKTLYFSHFHPLRRSRLHLNFYKNILRKRLKWILLHQILQHNP
jgi:hypothetical protein